MVNRSATGLSTLGADVFLNSSGKLAPRRNFGRDLAIQAAARIEYFDC